MAPKRQAPESSGVHAGFGKAISGQAARAGPYTTPPDSKHADDAGAASAVAAAAVGALVPKEGEPLGESAPQPALIITSTERLKMVRAMTGSLK